MLIALKSLLAIVAVGSWLWTQNLLRQGVNGKADQIEDLIHRRTARINSLLNASPRAANFLLISSSLIVDVLGVFLLGSGIFGDSIRPLLGLVVLFSLRQVNQVVTSLPIPPGMIWRDPGVPSLFVTYKVTNDLFFSGHTALLVFGSVEIIHTGNAYLSVLALLASTYQVAVVLLLRAHWTLDVFTGGLAALWVAALAGTISPSIDTWLARLL